MVIDTHSHLYPRSYVNLLRARHEPPQVVGVEGEERLVTFPEEVSRIDEAGRPFTREFWDIQEKLTFMDRENIDVTVVTLGNPWLDPFENGAELARSMNDEFARLRGATESRIIGTGTLPSDSLASAIEATKDIQATDDLAGIVTGPQICGRLLDDPELDALWAVLQKNRTPLLIHPKGEAFVSELGGYDAALPVGLGFPFETTVALTRLVFAGVLERFPDLVLVAAHGGGTLPYLAGRLDMVWATNSDLHKRLDAPPSESLRRLFLDTLVYESRSAAAAEDLVTRGHLLYGTDHPWAHGWRDAVVAAFEGETLDGVMWRSANRIFGLRIANQ